MPKSVKCPHCGKRTSWSQGNDNGPCDHCGVWISLPHDYRKKSKMNKLKELENAVSTDMIKL